MNWIVKIINVYYVNVYCISTTGCPKEHGNLISSLLWISILITNFKSHNIFVSARVYFMKRVKDCKDMSIMYNKEFPCLLGHPVENEDDQ